MLQADGDQAELWAFNKFRDNVANYEYVRPSIVKLYLDIDLLRRLNGLAFDSPSDSWAEFVYNCRKEGLSNRIYHNYDYICGPLADGKTAPLVKQLLRGAISLQDFHSQVSPKRLEDQLSFNTLQALQCIKDMEVFTIEKLTPAG